MCNICFVIVYYIIKEIFNRKYSEHCVECFQSCQKIAKRNIRNYATNASFKHIIEHKF